jgi:Bacteriophage peptidoglycan hydrolase
MTDNSDSRKPQRLYFKSYLKVVNNSVGSNLFRNFYVQTDDRGEFDAFDDGENSCAFFVSAILVIFKKIQAMHGTVQSTIEDLNKSGWQLVNRPKAGDVLVWEAQQFDDGLKAHIGFYLGDNKAISTSWTKRTPVEHDIHFGKANRKITHIFRMENWEDDTQTS